MHTFQAINSIVRELRPHNPLHVYRPDATKRAVNFFLSNFKGKTLYAVKTNPERHVLEHLYALGVRAFDVASLDEIKLVSSMFKDVELYFMHTVKSRYAIREAYGNYGIRSFSLDSTEELQKILDETNHAHDLNLYVRIGIPNTYAELNLADKFGTTSAKAVRLLKECKKYAAKLGVCFHVGSQCMHPDAYRIAIRMAKQVIDKAKVNIDMLDVGGGFPSIYPGMTPPPIGTYLEAIQEEFKLLFNDDQSIQLFCEPGRALVAESGAVIVRVELRKGNHLYINDGTYGNLFDAGFPHFIYPVRLIRLKGKPSENIAPFSFYGPTCDTLDYMKGPFYLPEDVCEGDFIEIGQLGAYGRTLATRFNGFGSEEGVTFVRDKPLMTMYGNGKKSPEPLQIVAA